MQFTAIFAPLSAIFGCEIAILAPPPPEIFAPAAHFWDALRAGAGYAGPPLPRAPPSAVTPRRYPGTVNIPSEQDARLQALHPCKDPRTAYTKDALRNPLAHRMMASGIRTVDLPGWRAANSTHPFPSPRATTYLYLINAPSDSPIPPSREAARAEAPPSTLSSTHA